MYTTFDSYEDISMDDSTFSEIASKKLKNGQGACAICGAKSTGVNFDVLTCSSCKAFFRRNGVKPLHQFVCRSSGNCKIDERSRRQCTACRLQKCFAMGMIKERIRSEEQNQRHRELVEENRRQKLKKHIQQQEDNRFKLVEGNRQRLSVQSLSSSCSISSSQLNDIDFIFDLFIENTKELRTQNFHFQFDHDLTNVLNSYCAPMAYLITFLKQLYHFQQLPIDDRLLLLKNNMKILLPLLTHLLNTTFGIQIYVNQSGLYNINQKISSACSLVAHISPDDNKLLTLLIVVLLFSPCLLTSEILYDAGQISSNSRQFIRNTYDEYTQNLWLYLLEKSFDNEEQSILIQLKIVTTILQIQNIMSEVYDIVQCSVQIDRLHMMMQSILHLS